MHVMPLSTKPKWMRGHRSMPFYIACASAVVAVLIFFANALPRRLASPDRPAPWKHLWGQGSAWHFEPIRDSRNLGLTDEQCDVRPPGRLQQKILADCLARLPSQSSIQRSIVPTTTLAPVQSSRTRSRYTASASHGRTRKSTSSSTPARYIHHSLGKTSPVLVTPC